MLKPEQVIPAGFFADAVKPTDEEIIRWAYIEGADYPPEMSQDWDLCVAEPRRADLFVRLADDLNCPNRKFFLSCLYLLIGDAVRSKGRTWTLEDLQSWLSRQSQDHHDDLKIFFSRAGQLLSYPETFEYNKWCWHGYAYGIEN